MHSLDTGNEGEYSEKVSPGYNQTTWSELYGAVGARTTRPLLKPFINFVDRYNEDHEAAQDVSLFRQHLGSRHWKALLQKVTHQHAMNMRHQDDWGLTDVRRFAIPESKRIRNLNDHYWWLGGNRNRKIGIPTKVWVDDNTQYRWKDGLWASQRQSLLRGVVNLPIRSNPSEFSERTLLWQWLLLESDVPDAISKSPQDLYGIVQDTPEEVLVDRLANRFRNSQRLVFIGGWEEPLE